MRPLTPNWVNVCCCSLPTTSCLRRARFRQSAKKHAARSEIDPSDNGPHSLLGAMAALCDYDWMAAAEAFSKAIGVSTVSGYSRWLYASFYLGPLGRYDEAVAQMRQAVEHDPLNVTWRTNLAIALHALKRNDEARDQLHKALEIDPQNWGSHFILGQTAMATGDSPAAVAAAERAHAVHPQHSMPSGLLAAALVRAGDAIAQRHSSVSRAIRQPRSTEGPCITSTVRRSIRRPRVGRR